MKKILKYLLFVLTFCVVFFISFKINIHRLEFAPMKLMETEWDDSVGTVYVDLDYENENGNTYNLYVPANLDKEKEQYLILYIHGGSFNSGAKGDGDIWCRYLVQILCVKGISYGKCRLYAAEPGKRGIFISDE